jgi:NitT/TauT family transport system permease protein
MKEKTKASIKLNVHRILFGMAVLGLWELVSGEAAHLTINLGSFVLRIPYQIEPFWISSPSEVISRLYELTQDNQLAFHLSITLFETVVGFIIGATFGIAIGFWLGRKAYIAKVVDPYIMAVYSLPKIALAPLFILWFGIGVDMKIAIAAIIVFFLVFYNTFGGVRTVDPDLVDVIRIIGAKEGQIMRKVVLPSTYPWIFTGFKLGIPYALIGAVVGELIATNKGMGYLLMEYSGWFDTGGVFAVLFILMVVATILNLTVNFVEDRLMRWRQGLQSF